MMEHQKKDKRKHLVLQCRYYKGEEVCPFIWPFGIRFWSWEKEWVDALVESWDNKKKIANDYLYLPELKPFTMKDLDCVREKAHSMKMPFTLYLFFAVRFAQEYGGGFKHEMEENFDFTIVDSLKHRTE